jgi:RND family efflux transporter MFP subunit
VALEAAEGALARVESEARLTDARLRRLQALSRSQIVSSAALEEAQHARDIARASVREAQAARERAAHDLERCSVRAPFSGRVRERRVELGQLVSRGSPLALVYAVDEAEIRLPILASELAVLDLEGVGEIASPMDVRLHGEVAGRAVSWRARIAGSEGEISPGTRTLHLIARIRDPFALGSAEAASAEPVDRPPALSVGQWLTAEIPGRVLADVFALPRAVLQGPSEVWVVDAANRLRSRSVRVVRTEGEEIWVGDGLSEGDRVVVVAGNRVPGERVRAVEQTASARVAAAVGASP